MPTFGGWDSRVCFEDVSIDETRWDEMRWDEMRWDEMRWDEMRWAEMSWAEMSWDELRSYASAERMRSEGCTKISPQLLEEGLGCVCVSGCSIQLKQREAALGNSGDVVHLQCLQVLRQCHLNIANSSY